jgi:hypothetical protein
MKLCGHAFLLCNLYVEKFCDWKAESDVLITCSLLVPRHYTFNVTIAIKSRAPSQESNIDLHLVEKPISRT